MKNKVLIVFFLLISYFLAAKGESARYTNLLTSVKFPLTIKSPDSKLRLEFNHSLNGEISYSFTANSKTLIKNSKMGLSGIRKPLPASASRRSFKSVWKPVWGKRAIVPEIYNEMILNLKTYKIIVRAYNDGVAFRYDFPVNNATSDLTQFNFSGNYTAWYYNGESANIGPEKLADCGDKRLPVMTIKVDNNNYLAIHEADLSWGEPLVLQSQKSETLFTIASKPNNAWKVIMYGAKPGNLVDSHLIELLNPPQSKELDFSWVKPGVAVWDWRIAGARSMILNMTCHLRLGNKW